MTTTPTLPAPTGVTARYQGSGLAANTTNFYYWVQALYPNGWSQLSAPANTGAYCPAALSGGNFVAVQWNFAPGAIGFLVFRNTTGNTPVNGATAIFIATAETGFKDDGSTTTISQVPRYDGIYVAHMLYDFNVDGGVYNASGAIVPAVSDVIPKGALVFGGLALGIVSLVGPTDVELGTSAGSSQTSILGSTAIASIAAGDIIELIGNNSQAGTNKAPFVMTAAGQMRLTLTAANATAGSIEVFLFYVIPANL